MEKDSGAHRLGLLGATRIGIGAIVGGGILVLGGTAFEHTGPSAVVAFALNGLLASMTAMSFAEMASAFPESGGAYAFARRVLSVRAAFAAGWVLWLAYIVAGVLYALGFGVYLVSLISTLLAGGDVEAGRAAGSHGDAMLCALVAIACYTLVLIRRPTGGGELSTWGKVLVLGALVVAGLWAFAASPSGMAARTLTPFFPSGVGGLVSAMGFTFIALQGFDLIAAVAGDVDKPAKTIPRAMFLSLGAALAIYLPLLLIVATVGVSPAEDIQSQAARDPDTLMAAAAGQFMGPAGYWMVTVAAVLSTLSALHANLLAASRVAHTMARDRTLPWVIGITHAELGTPAMAVYSSALAMAALMFMLPDLSAAGAAASLIFLLSFTLAHATAYLARRRMVDAVGEGYRSPAFPLVPIAGGGSCVALAAFQAVVEPSAGGIALVWLGLGVVLYLALFSERAVVVDAAAEARDLDLARLRGRSRLVLVPIGNPSNATAMVQVASALAPPRVGKVLLLTVVRSEAADPRAEMSNTEKTLRRGLTRAFEVGHLPEAMVTVAPNPWAEIERVALERGCQSLLLGLTDLGRQGTVDHLERLMNALPCDISLMRIHEAWDLGQVCQILVPIGGGGNHDALRARLLASLNRTGKREVTFVRVVPQSTSEDELAVARRNLTRLAKEEVHRPHVTHVIRSDDPLGEIAERAGDADLLIIGLQRVGRQQKRIGAFGLELARRTDTAMIMIGVR